MSEIKPNTVSTLYQTDEDGVFVAAIKALESPEEPGVYLIPRGCITVEPPPFNEGEQARWEWTSADAGQWLVEPIPAPPEPEAFEGKA